MLTPLGVGPGQPFPFISPLSLSLGVLVRDPDTDEERFARLKVPEGLPRFMRSNRAGPFLPLERVIAHFLPRLFTGMEIEERGVFRVTRDADFEVSDEADDLLEALQTELRRTALRRRRPARGVGVDVGRDARATERGARRSTTTRSIPFAA